MRCDLSLHLISSFPIVESTSHPYNHLKVDNNSIYVTIWDQNQIYHYNKDGQLQNLIGQIAGSSNKGEFDGPKGLTINKGNLYVCDYWNHRVQAVNKIDYAFHHQWGNRGTRNGQFTSPCSIYHNIFDDVFYIGDRYSIQLFACDGKMFIQRLGSDKESRNEGDFDHAWGICAISDKLYISDRENKRIQMFKKQDF